MAALLLCGAFIGCAPASGRNETQKAPVIPPAAASPTPDESPPAKTDEPIPSPQAPTPAPTPTPTPMRGMGNSSLNLLNEGYTALGDDALYYVDRQNGGNIWRADPDGDNAEMLKQWGVISPYAFPDKTGNRTDPIRLYRLWTTCRRQHSIQSSLHEMQHTLVSVAKADVPEELLKPAIGHTGNMDTFGVYGHDVEGEMQRVAGILDDVFDQLLE